MLGHQVQNLGALSVTADQEPESDQEILRARRRQQAVWCILAVVGGCEVLVAGWLIGLVTAGKPW